MKDTHRVASRISHELENSCSWVSSFKPVLSAAPREQQLLRPSPAAPAPAQTSAPAPARLDGDGGSGGTDTAVTFTTPTSLDKKIVHLWLFSELDLFYFSSWWLMSVFTYTKQT